MKKLICLLVASLLAGCAAAPEKPVEIEKDFFNTGPKKIGVVLAKLPQPDVFLPGANCLLCIAAAEIANSDLSTHAETLIPDDFSLVKSELVKQLNEKGVDTVVIEDAITIDELPEFKSSVEGVSKRDFTSFKSQYGISHLLVIDINSIGFRRQYSSYVPVDDPKAMIIGVGFLVDLSSNAYKWYKHIEVYKSASGNWDEPPDYPALTNAFYQAVEHGRESILSEF